MTEPLWVDPTALSGAGGQIAAVGDGLTAALTTLTTSYDASAGQDAAGAAFGFAYQDSAQALVDAVATGVNAVRRTGYLVQGSATNYSRAEAAADISGRSVPLPAPTVPAEYSSPAGDPDVNGPGESPPVLWYLVEFLVGDFWPNGKPEELRAAATAWRSLATPLYQVASDNAGAYGTIDTQKIPERESMKKAVRDIGTAMSSIAWQCQNLANQLGRFATDVENTQNAIRDLLDTLKSVVSSVIDNGIVGTIIEFVSGDGADDKIREVADDIKAVLDNHKRQSAALKELIARGKLFLDAHITAMEIIIRRELVDYFGESTGGILANGVDAVGDIGIGLNNSIINLGEFVALGIDPLGDPEGTWATVEGLGRMLVTFNPMTGPAMFAFQPCETIDLMLGMSHVDDIFTSDRPFVAVGETLFDVATAIVPGGGITKAGTGARAAGEEAEAGRVARAGEGIAIRATEVTQAGRNLGNISRNVDGVTERLDDIAVRPPVIDPSPAPGRPVTPSQLPEPLPPPVVRDPLPPPVVRDPVPPPVTLTRELPGGVIDNAPIPVRPVEIPSATTPFAPSGPGASTHTPAPSPGSPTSSAPPLGVTPHGAPSQPLGLPGAAPHGAPQSPHPPGAADGPAPHDGPGPGHTDNPRDATDPSGGHRDPDDKPGDTPGTIPVEEIPPPLAHETPYETGSMDPHYLGEQCPGGPMGSPGVRYLDEAGSEQHRITIHDGLVYDSEGNLFDTSHGRSAFGPSSDGRAIFVMDEDGNLYASTYQAYRDFHHTSLLGGRDVAGAGEMIVGDGRIELLTDRSGHYAPGRSRTQQVLDQLARQGIIIDPRNIQFFAPRGS